MHMILKSDLKMAQTSARCIPDSLLENDCSHNHASYNFKLSDVLSYPNGDLLLVNCEHELHYQIIFLQILHDNAEIMEKFTSKIRLQCTV